MTPHLKIISKIKISEEYLQQLQQRKQSASTISEEKEIYLKIQTTKYYLKGLQDSLSIILNEKPC